MKAQKYKHESLLRNKCVFFSTQYPYETTLKNEFEVMSERFEKIYYIPTSLKNGDKPELPKNVVIIDQFSKNKANWKRNVLLHFFPIITIFLSEAFKTGFAYIRYWKTYLSIAAKNYSFYLALKKFIMKEGLKEAMFYDYWFENATLAIALLRRRGIIKNAVCRAHGFDLYDERWREGKVPFRFFKLKYIDQVFCVSDYGYNYLLKKSPKIAHKKISMSYLGVKGSDMVAELPENEVPLIISVSNTQEFKRVHLIPNVLNQLNFPVNWVHFGAGPKDHEIRHKTKELPSHIRANLMGNVTNEEIHKFYSQNKVDFFLSLSIFEGLPISMMEAISFGTPIIAMNVFGIPELVNDTTGVLIPEESSLEEIAKIIKNTVDNKKFDRFAIRDFFRENFDYRKNYQEFFDGVLKE